jgi:ATP-dependent Lhr-like helicase
MARKQKNPEAPKEGDPLAGFHPAVGRWFRAALGSPTDVQAMAWPHIQNGESTLLLSPTGSGKTLAAFLAAVDRLGKEPASPRDATGYQARTRVLYVSPLKALAVDVEKNLRAPLVGIAEAARSTNQPFRTLTAQVRTGDTPALERAQMQRTPPDILITTPESLYLMLTSQQRALLAHVEVVIIDEIHQMVSSKRGVHLFLSLERLQALAPDRVLQRIGLSATQRPLDEIARLLGGFSRPGVLRPVSIVDASKKKALSITVEEVAPLPQEHSQASGAGDGLALGDADEPEDDSRSIWPAVHVRLVERIRAARSTMIFTNSRRLSERLASALNETAGEELALAHHGSVAKDVRRAIEERLKAGNLPAIVATSSLELGIDMGAVDQVIQVEAPPSVASGIQRIGRASHHVGGVPSGIIVPKHKHDLLACAAAAAGIEAGDVESTRYPKNPLDVLAQQIVAIVAVGLSPPSPKAARKGKKRALPREQGHTVDVEEVWGLVRHAAPFADLPRQAFDGLLDMLSGHYPSDEFYDLRPRINWDRTRGTLSPRAGTQRLAILNAGTIPDRGLYGVFLSDDASTDGQVATGSSKQKPARRVGELDEEMVFELREGEVFLLGASSWRADRITRDRVLVTPAAGMPGKMPFWHGDRAGRTAAFGERVGRLTRRITEGTAKVSRSFLSLEHHLDARAADTLTAYVLDQKRATGAVPSDKTIVVERVPDELGDLRICVLSPWGSRVHAPWAMAALARLREARAGDIEAVWSDDGIVFRVPGGETPPDTQLLFPSPDEIEEIVTRELAQSSLFAARFRESAARALLLPRQTVGKRTPLWAQRKRAADLLAVAMQYPSFPIVLETYREVLKDAFDLPALTELLSLVQSRKIKVSVVDSDAASPFAASLLFGFVGNFIYDEDAPVAERRAHALTIDHAQLRELLGETELRKLLDPDAVADHERMLQRREWPLKHGDAVCDLLRWLGDTTRADLLSRAEDKKALAHDIAELERSQRIVTVRVAGEERLIAVEDAGRYRDALGVVLPRGLPAVFTEKTTDALLSLVLRHARTHGPFVASDLAARFGLGLGSVEAALSEQVRRGQLVTGSFLSASRDGATEYVGHEVLLAIKQKTLAKLRKAIEPVDAATFTRFLCEWQGAASSHPRSRDASALHKALAQLEGCPIPVSVLEKEVLPARVPGYQPAMLDQLLASGEVVWAGIEPIGQKDGRVALYFADKEPLLSRDVSPEAPSGPLHVRLREVFERRGAVFFTEIVRTLGGYPEEILDALWDLVWSGEVTNDSFEPLRVLSAPKDDRRPRPGHSMHRAPRGGEGRWSLRRSRWMEHPTDTARASAIARSFLERYGVVLREAPAAEGLLGGFANVYEVYRAMEDQARVRRGYFVAGRGATQFALPGAEERLRARGKGMLGMDDERADKALVLASTDPANPYGALLPWPGPAGRAGQRSPGTRVLLWDGELVGWLGRGGKNLVTFFAADDPDFNRKAEATADILIGIARLKVASTILVSIDGAPAPESPLARGLQGRGFVSRQGQLVRMFRHESPPSVR